MSFRIRWGTNRRFRAISTDFEANEGEIRKTFEGIKRDKGALVDMGPCLLLATMRTDSSTKFSNIATNDLTADDVIVLLMGPLGSGKTTFIRIAAGIKGKVGHNSQGSELHTTDISAFRVSVPDFPDSNIVLVDTPAFDDTHKSDVEILNMISDWLNQTYKRGIQLGGLIYFHRISDAKMGGTQLRNWRAFENICGEDFNNVVLATTMWDNVDNEVGCTWEKELEEFWRANIIRGSCMKRFLHNRPSAADVLSPILENMTRRPLQLQREISDSDMSLKQTTAARALFSQLATLFRECEQNLVIIRDDLNKPSLTKQELRNLEEKYKKSYFLLKRLSAGLADLRLTPAERLQGFILTTGLRPALRFLSLRKRTEPEREGRPPRRIQADLPSRLKEQRMRQQLDASERKIQEYEELIATIYYKMCQHCKTESEKILTAGTVSSLAAIASSSLSGLPLPLGLDSPRKAGLAQNTIASGSSIKPLQNVATGTHLGPPKENPNWLVKYNNKSNKAALKVELEHVLTLEQEVLCSRFSWDGIFLAVGLRGKEGKTCIFDVKTGEQTSVLKDLFSTSKLGVRSLCFSPNGRYLATGDGVGQIRIWEFAKNYIRSSFRGHEKTPGTEQRAITNLDFSPNGRFLVSSSDDQSVCIWRIRDGSSTIFKDGGSYFKAVRFSRDGEYVAAANADGKVRMWDARTKQLVSKWSAHERPIFCVAVTGGGLVSGSMDHTLKCWDIKLEPRGPVRNAATVEETLELTGHKSYVRSAAISPADQWLASGSDDHTVRIWDTSNGALQCTLEGHQKDIWSVDFSPTGSYLACGSSDSQATLWRYESVAASA